MLRTGACVFSYVANAEGKKLIKNVNWVAKPLEGDSLVCLVIDREFAYDEDDDGQVFHQGHCAVNDSTGKCMGLIDRNGDWVIPPLYETRVRF